MLLLLIVVAVAVSAGCILLPLRPQHRNFRCSLVILPPSSKASLCQLVVVTPHPCQSPLLGVEHSIKTIEYNSFSLLWESVEIEIVCVFHDAANIWMYSYCRSYLLRLGKSYLQLCKHQLVVRQSLPVDDARA